MSTTEDTLLQTAEELARAAQLSVMRDSPPSQLPGYSVLRRLGQGKYGSVWLAREENTGQLVAIKFFERRRGMDWSLLTREVEKLSALYTSRHVVRLLAVGWDHDPPYYVMEYLSAGSLSTLLREGPMSVSQAVALMKGIARGLVHAHGSGILHCDLKPDNVLLDQDHSPRLCDFGQARLADERQHALGTLFYMAPEQADLKALPDARWDVYALGALTYHMLCGSPPYRTAENEAAISACPTTSERLQLYRRIIEQSPPPTGHRQVRGMDSSLAELIDRCLAVDPRKRLANAQAVLDWLEARDRFRARRPLLWMGGILPVMLILVLLPFAWNASHVAVSLSRSNLIQRALESDVLSAHLLADGLAREIRHRLEELQALAEDEEVRAAVQKWSQVPMEQRGPLLSLLDTKVEQLRQRQPAEEAEEEASWFLQDAEGYQRWRLPRSGTIDQRFHFRDYFHGQDRDYPEGAMPVNVQPIRQPHISRPYRSRSSQRYVVALSIPVLALPPEGTADEPQVVGVMARTFYLSQLLHDYERSMRAQGSSEGRQLALFDRRSGSLLAHPWMNELHLQHLERPEEQLRLDSQLLQQLETWWRLDPHQQSQQAALDRTDHYLDPVGQHDPNHYGGEWLAAFSPVGTTDWIAIVQEPRDPVLRPVEVLRERLIYLGSTGVTLVAVVIGLSWLILLWHLNDFQGQRRNTRLPSQRTDSFTPSSSSG
ncbi:MAG: serine/threonine protein kinase [Planctomycetaceae bacterium]|nr:MAG: serine/threonine protein kinase [Planctomycetaceae bacterium]